MVRRGDQEGAGFLLSPVRRGNNGIRAPTHRGEESKTLPEDPNYKPRRWVVERVHSWINRFRRLLIRWEKKPENYEAMLQFACGIIAWEQAALLG
jgi:transposase